MLHKLIVLYNVMHIIISFNIYFHGFNSFLILTEVGTVHGQTIGWGISSESHGRLYNVYCMAGVIG